MNNKKKFSVGFWNYNGVGYVDAKRAISDWRELGINLGMTSVYDCGKDEYKVYASELDEAEKAGMKLIVCDTRTLWKTLQTQGEAAFRKGVQDIRKAYGLRPSVYAFYVGDEPPATDFEDVIRAARIVKEIIPEKEPFVNFFPYLDGPTFRRTVNAQCRADYGEHIKRMVTQGDLPVICYDCYTQCNEDRSTLGLSRYFENLEFYGNLSKQLHKPFWTGLLSLGHWGYRVPTEDDFRWQLSTAAAYGCTGVLWFTLYTQGERSCRESPFYGTTPWERSDTFGRLKRQIYFFMHRFGDKFANSSLLKVMQYGEYIAETPSFCADEYIKHVDTVSYHAPLIVSEFEKQDGKKAIVFVNRSQERSTRVRYVLQDKFTAAAETELWLAPGDLAWIDIEEKTVC